MPDFLFRSAVIRTTTAGLEGKRGELALRLERAEFDWKGKPRRPLRLRLLGDLETTIEMSRSEAYAFSEWLDAAVTEGDGEGGSKARETK